MQVYIRNKFLTLAFLCSSIFWQGCRKFVDIDPPENSLVSSNVFSNTASAASVVTNFYMKIQANNVRSFCTFAGVSLGLSADELTNYNQGDPLLQKIYTNSLLSSINDSPNFWGDLYNEIYSINAAIEGINQSPNIPQGNKDQLLGECYFLRGYFYLFLTNVYGDIPLLLTTDYMKNAVASSVSQVDVFNQIKKDLIEAKRLLRAEYLTPMNSVTQERVRPNKGAATALLARVYLYAGEWQNAEIQSSEIIDNSEKYSLCQDLDKVFLMNSSESIWQLQPSTDGYNTFDGMFYILNSVPGTSSNPVSLSKSLINDFEIGDGRLSKWISYIDNAGVKYYFPYKYKISQAFVSVNEYHMILRLAEQYLIRAEARAHLDKLQPAKSDLNLIRNRAGLNNTLADSREQVLDAIFHERRVELFTEWGHRWFDLKRFGKITSVMEKESVIKGSTWSPNWELYPIPSDDILKNSNLKQNPGYN